MTYKSINHIRRLILGLLICSGYLISSYSQTSISGIINEYGRVTSLGVDYVIIDDAGEFAQFAEGDTVLLMQMKGVRIVVIEESSYGTPQDKYGQPGYHEFLVIQSVEAGTRKITFRNNIINSFDIDGYLQIIKVPSFNSAVVEGSDLTCAPWDSISGTGGVLAMIVGRTLSLNADIDVTGKGFAGGAVSEGTGLCVESDILSLDSMAYSSSSLKAGFKGESSSSRGYLAISDYPALFPKYAKGKGANFTGGGGGNGRFSGGGGGANYGAGGKGGMEVNDCSPFPHDGGLYGWKVKNISQLEGGIFLGGGGGASTYLSGSTPSAGGKGGGIVVIVCDTLKGNGHNLIANGESAAQASLYAGAGGGGGGGSVALYLQSFSSLLSTSALTISAEGGNGGDNTGSFGEGGGGGGGFINISDITFPANVTTLVGGGDPGSRTGGATAGNGAAGEDIRTYIPVLNGFLFNSVRSSVTGDQIDSICSDVKPKEISGTLPVGGSGSYTYQWQKSYDLMGPPSDIPLSNTVNYIPSDYESDTVWFRRIVEDDVTFLTDTSKWVMIMVQTAITGNEVGEDTIICYGQDPLPLIPVNTGPENGNGIYSYEWIQNNTDTEWDSSPSADGVFDNAEYDPPNLTDTTYYQRVVTSGRCINYSSTVTVTVLPSITGNIINLSDSVICEGSLFEDLGASTPGGGDGTYKYQWQDSILSATDFSPSFGTNTGTTYSVDTSTFSVIEQRYYRRVVFSGPDSVCLNRSRAILLTRYHKIENNAIQQDQTICSGNAPLALTGTTPLQGSGVYTYLWQDSSKAGDWNTRATSDFSYSPPALTDTTWYRRIVNSSECSDTSLLVRIDVHNPITDNNISLSGGGTDTTICNGATPHELQGAAAAGGTDIPGDYAYQWLYSMDNILWDDVSAGGTGITYQPPSLSATTYYRRKVISGTCIDESSMVIKVTVLPLISDNIISESQTVCYNTAPQLLTGATLSGGAGAGSYTFLWEESADEVIWNPASGVNNSSTGTYQPPALTTPVKYRRIVKSGEYDCCQDTSNIIDIAIYPLPAGTITSTADTTVCEGSDVRLRISLTGASPWDVIYSENSVPDGSIRIGASDTTITVTPTTGSAMTSYTYLLDNIEDHNGCIATMLTGSRKADVYKIPDTDAGPDAVVCGALVVLDAVPDVGAGEWFEEGLLLGTTPSLTVVIDSSYTGSGITHSYIWKETNWQCVNSDTVTIQFDKRVYNINAGKDTILYSFDNTIAMVADPVMEWETGLWSVMNGTGDFDDYSDNTSKVRNLSTGLNTFLWTVTNGSCVSEDEINIEVYDLKIPEGFSPNNDPDNYNNTFIISGLDLPNQDAELTVINSAGTEVFSTSNTGGGQWVDWDGKNSSGVYLPEGTYYYLLKIISKNNGQVFKKSGFIILKRY